MSNNGFCQIPHAFARDGSISPEAKLVGMVYASLANGSRYAWPSLGRVQEYTGLGRGAAKRGRAELVRRGFLVDEQDRLNGAFGKVRYRVSERLLYHRRTENQSSG
jgi:hypothetical protein